MSGLLIAFEGIDGAGKSGHLRVLQKLLPEIYPMRKCIPTREPGGSPYAEEIRRLILESGQAGKVSGEVFIQLFGAARFDHVETVILPHCSSGIDVLSDRFEASTYAYQLVAQEASEFAWEMFELQHKRLRKILGRWVTIILDVDLETSEARMRARNEQFTHFDSRASEFKERLRRGYLQYSERYEDVHIVDARPSFETVQKSIPLEIEREFMSNH